MDEKIVAAILHYQSNLDKYSKRKDEDKMIHCMNRLERLPITVAHLEQTGVGRTVNCLRKQNGRVGEAAKKLVLKWKEIVEEEEEEEEQRKLEEQQRKHDEEMRLKKHKSKHSSHKKDRDEEKKHKKHKRNRKSTSSDEGEADSDQSDHRHKVKKKKSHHSHHERHADHHKNSKKNVPSSDEECVEPEGQKVSKRQSRSSLEEQQESPKKHKNLEEQKQKSKEKKRSSQSVETPTKKLKLSNKESIDCGSGASFAEALGMMFPSTSYSSNNSQKREEKASKSSTSRTESLKSSKKSDRKDKKEKHHSSGKSSSTKLNHSSNGNDDSKSLSPLIPLKLTTPDVNSLLPQISTNYKPLGLASLDFNMKNNPHLSKKLDDQALTRLMYSKSSRTKVYSGNKNFFGKVPSLFELCTRVLQDNIDALEVTGGVPYSILKPVLEKATAEQLFTLEHYNPYLMDDSDELWQLHCQKLFKTEQRQEMETWRDMYLRCLDEREAKLKTLTANIKLSQDKAIPVRQTKLAYVDSMVKPPRNIAKKQAKNGIDNRPSNKLNLIATANTAGQVAVPNPVTQRQSSNSNLKPKKAPLMQKTLQLMKGRFRR